MMQRKKILHHNPIRAKRNELHSTNVVEVITKSLVAIAGTASLVYILGLLIVNISLFGIGVRVFDLEREIYIAAGTLFLFFCSIVITIVIFLSSVIRRLLTGTKPLKEILKNLATPVNFVIICIFLVLVATIVESLQPNDWQPGFYFRLMNYLFVLIGIGIGIEMIIHKSKTSTPISIVILVGVTILLLLPGWARYIYPNISPGYGGGAPIKVQLVISDVKNSNLFTEIGLDITKNVSAPLELIDDTSDTLFVIFDNAKGESQFAKLDKSLIAIILYPPLKREENRERERQILEKWFGTATPTITPTLIITSTP